MAVFTSNFTYLVTPGGTNQFTISDSGIVNGAAVVDAGDNLITPSEVVTATFPGNPALNGSYTYQGFESSFDAFVAKGTDGLFYLFSSTAQASNQNFNIDPSATFVVVCFAAGTLIRTLRGDVAIETLKASDLVVTGSGQGKPIKWVGHRVIDCRSHPNPRAVLPVRIAADAFGPGRPSRDLLVSPAHSICVDLCGEVLIHAANLVNGATIAQVEVDEIDYWHVELDSHDILIANNLTAESYLDTGNRGFFAEAGATLDVYETGLRTFADFCRPVLADGPVLQFVSERLMARAEAIGWTPSRDADLQLLVDGETCRPFTDGETSIFHFPASARDVRLQSNTFVPGDVGGGDPRALGVMLGGLAVSAGSGDETRPIALSDPRIQDGLHPEEGRSGVAWRWTKGDLKLSPDLWAGLSDQIALRVSQHDSGAIRRWLPPEHAVAELRPQPAARKTEPKPKPRADLRVVRGAA